MRLKMYLMNETALSHDDEGQDYADLAAARAEMVRTAGNVIAFDFAEGKQAVKLDVVATDENGNYVATLKVDVSFAQTKVQAAGPLA